MMAYKLYHQSLVHRSSPLCQIRCSISFIFAPCCLKCSYTIVSQLSKCLKFVTFWGVILYRIQSILSPRIDLNFRHLLSCDTIVAFLLYFEVSRFLAFQFPAFGGGIAPIRGSESFCFHIWPSFCIFSMG